MVLTSAMMPRSISGDYWDGVNYCNDAPEYISGDRKCWLLRWWSSCWLLGKVLRLCSRVYQLTSPRYLSQTMMKWSHTCHWVYEIHWPLTFQQHNQKLNLNFWCELIELKPGGLSGRTTSRLGLSRRRRWGHQLSSISDSAKFCAFRMYVINIGITVC